MTIVCLRCRKKKAKCDKNHPCNQCIRFKCPSECTYETKPPSVGSSPDDKDSKPESVVQLNTPSDTSGKFPNEYLAASSSSPLKVPISIHLDDNEYLIGVNPTVSSSDFINLHMNLYRTAEITSETDVADKSWPLPYRGIKVAARPVGFNEVSQQENGATLFWRYSYTDERMRNALAHMLSVRDPHVVKSTAQHFGPMFISNVPRAPQEAKKLVSLYGLAAGFLFSDNCSETDHFHDSLRTIYPRRGVLMTYLEWFFAKVYPFYPIVDEAWIFEQANRLFTYSESGDKLLLVNSSSRVDFLIIGIILIMTRLAFLAELTNLRPYNESILSAPRIDGYSMNDFPITLSAVDLAYELIHQGSYKKKISFLFLQACMFKCIYRMTALENEAALYSFDSDCSVNHLVSMAVSLSLERDPDNIRRFPGEKKHRNLRRKIWYTLVQMDYHTIFIFNSARCIAPDSFCIVLPYFTEESSNIRDLELEKKTIESMREICEVLMTSDDVISFKLNLRKSYKVSAVIQSLHEVEVTAFKRLGSTGQIIQNANDNKYSRTLSVAKLRAYVLLRIFIATIYYFLYVYYQQKGDHNLEFFFLRKIILNIYSEMHWISSELIIKSSDYFESNFTLIMSPVMAIYAHIASMASLGIQVQLRCYQLTNTTPEDKLQVVQDVLERNLRNMYDKLKMCKLLGERYFFAWKCSKAHSAGCEVIHGTHFYDSYTDLWTKMSVKFSTSQLLDLAAAYPDEPMIKLHDNTLLKQYCYADCRTVEETSMRGSDLYKSIQTDHFWILFNSISEKELVFFGVSASAKNHAQDIQGVTTPGVRAPINYRHHINQRPQHRSVRRSIQLSSRPSHEMPQAGQRTNGDQSCQGPSQINSMPIQINADDQANSQNEVNSVLNPVIGLPPPMNRVEQQTPNQISNPPNQMIQLLNHVPIPDLSQSFPCNYNPEQYPDNTNAGNLESTSQEDLYLYSSDIIPDLRDLLDLDQGSGDPSLDDFFACSLYPTNAPENT